MSWWWGHYFKGHFVAYEIVLPTPIDYGGRKRVDQFVSVRE